MTDKEYICHMPLEKSHFFLRFGVVMNRKLIMIFPILNDNRIPVHCTILSRDSETNMEVIGTFRTTVCRRAYDMPPWKKNDFTSKFTLK